jgi:hypothetical protein
MRRSCRLALLPAVALLVSACAMKNPEPAPLDKPAASAVPVRAAASKLGAPITAAPAVALASIAKDPAAYADKNVVTTGTVTAVCQAMGCWMEIKDDGDALGQAHVKMHGHSFFIPKDASGRKARVQAVVEKTDPAEECSQEAEQQTGKPVAKVQLDALGVELM